MAKSVLIAATITLMLVSLCHHTTSRALPRRDLIDGPEFLSLFINSANKGTSPSSYKKLSTHENSDNDPDNPFNALTTQKYEFETDRSELYLSKSKEIEKLPRPNDEQSTSFNSISVTENANSKKDVNHKSSMERKQIIQLVTSGSKVVFLEELNPFEHVHKDQNSNDVSNEMHSTENVPETISSTVGLDQDSSGSELEVTEIDASVLDDNVGHFADAESATKDFISRSHKAELSVDVSDPITLGIADTMSSESNVHQVRQKPEPHADQHNKNIVPIQTVIYHDNYRKSTSAQARSVSYSSISQSVDQPNSWPNPESYDEARKNVSDDLQPKSFQEPAKVYSEPAKVYGEPEKVYGEPAKVYSKPSQVYGQPAKFYSEPAKVYSEPSKVYSEPSKVYSEPAKVYSVPAKTYWPPPLTTTQPMASTTTPKSVSEQTMQRKVIFNLDKLPYDLLNAPDSSSKLLESKEKQKQASHASSNQHRNLTAHHFAGEDDGSYRPEHHGHVVMVTQRPNYRPTHFTESSEDVYTPTPEQNYEVEESVSVKTNGRAHGIQPISPSTIDPNEDAKVGYVFEGRNYRKYRVEEKTADGFIVGEYGVVSHNDGSLRGVRYTADSNINPSLIHDALMKFLSL